MAAATRRSGPAGPAAVGLPSPLRAATLAPSTAMALGLQHCHLARPRHACVILSPCIQPQNMGVWILGELNWPCSDEQQIGNLDISSHGSSNPKSNFKWFAINSVDSGLVLSNSSSSYLKHQKL